MVIPSSLSVLPQPVHTTSSFIQMWGLSVHRVCVCVHVCSCACKWVVSLQKVREVREGGGKDQPSLWDRTSAFCAFLAVVRMFLKTCCIAAVFWKVKGLLAVYFLRQGTGGIVQHKDSVTWQILQETKLKATQILYCTKKSTSNTFREVCSLHGPNPYSPSLCVSILIKLFSL